MQFYLIDWRHKHTHTHTHTYTQNEPETSGLYWRPPARGKASWRSEPILGPLCLVRSSTIRCGRTRTRHAMPLQAQAGDPCGTGSQAHRPQEKMLCWWDPRKATTGFRKPPEVRRQNTRRQFLRQQLSLNNNYLAHARVSYPPLALPHWAERTLYAHIWSQARTKRLCPYLGLSQSATLVPIFGAKSERNACAHIWG